MLIVKPSPVGGIPGGECSLGDWHLVGLESTASHTTAKCFNHQDTRNILNITYYYVICLITSQQNKFDLYYVLVFKEDTCITIQVLTYLSIVRIHSGEINPGDKPHIREFVRILSSTFQLQTVNTILKCTL